MMCFRALFSVALLSMGSALFAASDAPLRVGDPWIRDAPPTARMRSGYGVLENLRDYEIEVVSVSSPDFGLVELHETRLLGDVAKMVALPSVKIAPRGKFELRPGGAHLMLMRPKRELSKGDSTLIVLTTKAGEKIETAFVVGGAKK